MQLFYTILLSSQVFLLAVGLCLNAREWRMAALTAVVLCGAVFTPVSTVSPQLWYVQCLLGEIMVAMAACCLRAGVASSSIVLLSMLLGVCHLSGMFYGPQPGVGIYRAIEPIFEIAECLVCILMSRPSLNLFKKILSNKTWRH